jgi:hypothetical protein
MNISSASGTSSLWSLLAAQASSSTSSSSGTGSDDAAFSLDDAGDAGTTSAVSSVAAGGSPSAPDCFDMSASTMQFAQSLGGADGGSPPQDPLLSLDANGDGSVSSTEFGLDGASSDVQQLFSAIDSNGDGALSTDEIDSFHKQMMAALEGPGTEGGAMEGPPPLPSEGLAAQAGTDGSTTSSQGGSSNSSSSDSSSDGTGTVPDLSVFLQQLASRYLAVATGGDFATQTSSVSATA